MVFSICLAILGLLFIYLEFFLPGWVLGTGGGVLIIFSIGLFLGQTTALMPVFIFLGILAILAVYTCNLALKRRVKLKKDEDLN